MGFYVAPTRWEIQHASQIFAGQQYAAAHNGQLPDTPAWRMLEFRHSLNAKRFNYYHPNVGRILELAGGPPPAIPNVPPPATQTITPDPPSATDIPSPPPPGSTVAQELDPPVPQIAPEPSAVVMMALAMISAVLFVGFQRLRHRLH